VQWERSFDVGTLVLRACNACGCTVINASADALVGAAWTCASSPPGALQGPEDLDAGGLELEWLPAAVPGTAASALANAGRWSWGTDDEAILDGQDWWFRCRFVAPAGEGPWELELGGVATLADGWLNGAHLVHGENMFTSHRVAVSSLRPANELVIRCAALGPALGLRHPRPRWKSRLVRSQSLRWYRTTLLGRMPGWSRWAAPVGPWRPVRLLDRSVAALTAADFTLRARCDDEGPGGTVSARALVPGAPCEARLHVGGDSAPLTLVEVDDGRVAEGELHLERVDRWWPHTHGPQPLYPVELELDSERFDLGQVGFRTTELDRADGGFQVIINGLRIFCRGAVWGSPDTVSFAPSADHVRASVELARDGGMNMLRVAGYETYENADFWDACDELGIMVWQDCMFASLDPAEDEQFVAGIHRELREVFGALAGRPALTIACGSSEVYQQAAMFGLSPARCESPLLERAVPDVLAAVVPGVPYVPSAPSGGEPPFAPNVGVSHYFGVGAYLRPVSDARLAGVRFAAECLSFGTPPERETVREVFGDSGVAGHDPRWKLSVPRDAGSSWDFEDVRDHYVRELFGVDPFQVRYADPDHALDLGRAAIAELMGVVVSEWRRSASPCAGALVLMWRDLWPGAGWGVIDSLGRPKASFYALRRAFAPTAVSITDEGLAGLWLHVFNDGPNALQASVELRVFNDAGVEIESTRREIGVPAHGSLELRAEALLDGFRDLNHVYRFSPLAHDVVAVELRDDDGRLLGSAWHLAAGPARPRHCDLGLAAQAHRDPDGKWMLTVSSTLFAQYVALDVPGFRPSDSWFHLLPGESRTVALHADDRARVPAGSVRALNGPRPIRISLSVP
jgi:beta-mannosidase